MLAVSPTPEKRGRGLREASRDRKLRRPERREVAKQDEIPFGALAEAEARVDGDFSAGIPAPRGRSAPRRLPRDVGGGWPWKCPASSGIVSLHVHQDDCGAGLGTACTMFGSCRSADVVDDVGAGAASRRQSLSGVDEMGRSVFQRSSSITGTCADLLLRRHRRGLSASKAAWTPRPSTIAARLEHRERAATAAKSRSECHRRKRVGRDVDPHDMGGPERSRLRPGQAASSARSARAVKAAWALAGVAGRPSTFRSPRGGEAMGARPINPASTSTEIRTRRTSRPVRPGQDLEQLGGAARGMIRSAGTVFQV